jgi:hypothetical protein
MTSPDPCPPELLTTSLPTVTLLPTLCPRSTTELSEGSLPISRLNQEGSWGAVLGQWLTAWGHKYLSSLSPEEENSETELHCLQSSPARWSHSFPSWNLTLYRTLTWPPTFPTFTSLLSYWFFVWYHYIINHFHGCHCHQSVSGEPH